MLMLYGIIKKKINKQIRYSKDSNWGIRLTSYDSLYEETKWEKIWKIEEEKIINLFSFLNWIITKHHDI